MWKSFRHPNILPLLGVTMAGTRLVMVSEWMMNGSIDKFVESHPNTDRFELVCLPIMTLPTRSADDDGLVAR